MNYDLEKYLLHKPPMRLIDRVISVDDEKAMTKSTITKEHLFYEPDMNGVDALLLIELMAQTTAVFASNQQGAQEPRIGFLVSVRGFSCEKTSISLHETITIIASKEFLDDNMGVFNCTAFCNGKEIANAKLSAYQP